MRLKMINELRNYIFFVLASLMFIMFISFVNAFAVGVSGDLTLYPGQTLDIGYDIMNTIGGSGDITVEGAFLEGSEIASFTGGKRFNVPAGSVVPVPVRYKIPANAVIGSVYPIKVIFKTVSEGTGSGNVNFAEDVVRTLNIGVGEKPAGILEEKPAEKGKAGAVFGWIIAIIIIILIVWLILKKKKR